MIEQYSGRSIEAMEPGFRRWITKQTALICCGAIMVRHTVLFSGRVQGVGFRYSAVAIARRFAVAGYVRNLGDGHVELVAEGDGDEVSRFIAAIRDHMVENITDVEIAESAATGEYATFAVRH